MITGALKQQVDKLWTTFWTGGISNPLSVIEQITYLLFMRLLDETHTLAENKAKRTKQPIARPIFGAEQQHLRWSALQQVTDPRQLFERVRDEVFPFLKNLHGDDSESSYARHMRDAVFMVPSPQLLRDVFDQIGKLTLPDRDTKGDLYEYMLSKLSTAGTNGQFRTPRHIIRMMVALVEPTVDDTVCDPACGTAGFLVGVAEHVQADPEQSKRLLDKRARKHFDEAMFHGYDFDSTMLRIGSMNMILHGIARPKIEQGDSLSKDMAGLTEQFTLVLANPPFKGSLAHEQVAANLVKAVKTKKTELLFLARILYLLEVGGRAAVIVPDGVLFGSSKAHRDIRKSLVEQHQLQGVISMPAGVFKPYAGVSTAVLVFSKTNAGGTDKVFFYDMTADGYSLDDKRNEIADNDIPDVIAQWKKRSPKKVGKRTGKWFLVPVAEIRENKYDLSINRYKETVSEAVEHEAPQMIIRKLRALEEEILRDLGELEGML
ncbi:type I restriction-modification system subunit M [Nannocystaceae bacterium ST9]